MNFVEIKPDIITLQLTHKEFNVFREVISAVLVSCGKEEIPTLTGCSVNELLNLGVVLSEIADHARIDL